MSPINTRHTSHNFSNYYCF